MQQMLPEKMNCTNPEPPGSSTAIAVTVCPPLAAVDLFLVAANKQLFLVVILKIQAVREAGLHPELDVPDHMIDV
eukprot:10931508-Ditylum_brightwellii.AAC.1